MCEKLGYKYRWDFSKQYSPKENSSKKNTSSKARPNNIDTAGRSWWSNSAFYRLDNEGSHLKEV